MNSALSDPPLPGTAVEWSGAAHRQTKWDWRAVANFIGGGTGAGLLLVAVLAAPRDNRDSEERLAGCRKAMARVA